MILKFACAAALVCVATPALSADLLTNGNFESGLTGWTVANQAGGNGSWYSDTPGTTTPVSGMATSPNTAGGALYAVTDQPGPGAHVLTQSFTVAPSTTALVLSYDFFAHNSGSLTIKSTLDYTGTDAGFYRVDILTAGAAAFSTDAADIAQSLIVSTGSATLLPFQTVSYALDLAAGSYQLRFAEVDNVGFFNLGIDNVSINATTADVPEANTWVMMVVGFGIAGYAVRRARTRIAFA